MIRKTDKTIYDSDIHEPDDVVEGTLKPVQTQQGINSRAAARLAVLEKIAETHDRRITDIEDFHRSVVERFDQKIQLDAVNQVSMEKTLVKAVTTLDNLSNNLSKALELAGEANKLATKHETIGATVIKIGGILIVIVSGLWALYKFFIGI